MFQSPFVRYWITIYKILNQHLNYTESPFKWYWITIYKILNHHIYDRILNCEWVAQSSSLECLSFNPQAFLKPEPAEVSGCLWVDASLVKAIVSAVDGEEDTVHLATNLPQSVRYSWPYSMHLCSCGLYVKSIKFEIVFSDSTSWMYKSIYYIQP